MVKSAPSSPEHPVVARRWATLAAALLALVFSLYITFAAIQARHGGSDEEPYPLVVALLIACLPAGGLACAVLALLRARRGVRAAWLVLASFVLDAAGIAGILAGWGWIG